MDGPGLTKTCAKCGVEKTADGFSPDRRYRLGVRSLCKPCSSRYALDRRDVDREASRAKERAQRARFRAAHRQELPPVEASPTELAYLAGFIDGEGTVTVTHARQRLAHCVSPVLVVCNTYLPVMEHLRGRFGGTISKREVKKAHHRHVYILYWSSRRAVQLMEAVLPYLIIKRRHAELVIELSKLRFEYRQRPDGKRVRMVPDETLAAREPLVAELIQINRRGA